MKKILLVTAVVWHIERSVSAGSVLVAFIFYRKSSRTSAFKIELMSVCSFKVMLEGKLQISLLQHQEALKKRELWRLRDAQGKPPGVVGMWPSRAVTFIDNHDTGSTQASSISYPSLKEVHAHVMQS